MSFFPDFDAHPTILPCQQTKGSTTMAVSVADSSEFSLPDDLVAQASTITSREIRQLQMMNRVLVDKLFLVEGELKQLREKRGADEGRVMVS